MTRLSFIPAQFVKVVQATRADLAQYVVAGIYIKEGAPGVSRAWKVNADGSDGGEITFTNEGGKDDTVSAAILPTGDVRLVVSEALPPSGSGTTAQPVVYLIPHVFPPAPPVTAGEGDGSGQTFVAAPGGFIRIHEGAFDGQQTVNLASFGIPAAALLNLKVTVNAATVGARGRVGPHTGSSGAAMLATVVQAPNTRNYSFCQSAPGANNSLVLWADAGALSEFYVDVLGWWY